MYPNRKFYPNDIVYHEGRKGIVKAYVVNDKQKQCGNTIPYDLVVVEFELGPLLLIEICEDELKQEEG